MLRHILPFRGLYVEAYDVAQSCVISDVDAHLSAVPGVDVLSCNRAMPAQAASSSREAIPATPDPQWTASYRPLAR